MNTILFALPGGPEMLIIGMIIVLLFGASKLPKLARSAGQATQEFQRGKEQTEEELEEMRQSTPTNGDTQ